MTSLCELRGHAATVFHCDVCGHTQTAELENAAEFYDQDYRILVESEDEDQLYDVVDGKQVFRLTHQADTVLKSVDLPDGARVLDYGAAKGASLKKLCEQRPDLHPSLFDVSEMYVPFWERFVDASQWACYTIPDHWSGTFDLVTSYFVAEHVADLDAMLSTIRECLKPGGTFFFTVPNVFINIADLIVVDHVNHFSESSLRQLLYRHGFGDVTISDEAYKAAYVITARRAEHRLHPPANATGAEREQIRKTAAWWTELSDRIHAWEKSQSAPVSGIYGAGFYGSYLYSCLAGQDAVCCFADANQYLWGTERFGRPVVSPDEIPANVTHMLIGLNPVVARSVVAGIDCWSGRNFECFFLDDLGSSGRRAA